MQKLAGAIVLTSQGVPFLHAGSEFCRTKYGVENSFESPDTINRIDWSRKARYREVNDYFQALIRLRKNHPAFRLQTAKEIRENLQFLSSREHDNFIAYRINNYAGGDRWKTVLVLLNGGRNHVDYPLPPGTWTVVADQYTVNEKGLRSMLGADIRVPAISAMVLFEEN
jgi:pullulanase